MLQLVVVPAAAPGLVSAAMIAVARAVGETMLVTLAVGRVPEVGLDPRVAVAPLVAPGRADAAVGVPVLLCVLMVLGAWAMHLRRHHERRRDG
jgi:ABC-type phosphate transport system permease subunit